MLLEDPGNSVDKGTRKLYSDGIISLTPKLIKSLGPNRKRNYCLKPIKHTETDGSIFLNSFKEEPITQ